MAVSEITISQLGPKGDGISDVPEGKVFISRTMPGDKLRARIYSDIQGIHRADIVEMLEPSPLRQKAPCPHYEACGNCTLQHLNPDYYREWKLQVVRDALAKQRIQVETWLEPIFIGGGNRRRLNFSAIRLGGKVTLGYYRRRSRYIEEIKSCLIAHPKLFELRGFLNLALPAIMSEGDRLDIFFQMVGKSIDMIITGPVGRSGVPDAAMVDLLSNLAETTSIERIGWRPVDGEAIEVLMNRGKIVAEFGPLNVNLSMAAFLQPTLEGERVLVEAVMAALPKKGKFADLFSGCGTFSGPMLTRGTVHAYEMVQDAVNALNKAAGPKALKAFRRDLYKNPLRKEEINQYDAVVFDPPRAGCPEQSLAMCKSTVPLMIGVSCNPATFARDARILCGAGYKLKSVQVVDQFLYSHHVELVGVFTKS